MMKSRYIGKAFSAAFLSFLFSFYGFWSQIVAQERPNILWITCEDISPYLGSYGFEQAHTPNLDKMAKRSIQYSHAYANASVCAVACPTILSGMYASTIGSHKMGSLVQSHENYPPSLSSLTAGIQRSLGTIS